MIRVICFFFAKAKDGDYHQEMNGPTFLNWFENQLMPALKNPSVIVLDNASYHNIKTEETLIREKLSYKIIFQNTTFLFSPLKIKKLYKKIKFEKPLSRF